MRLDDTMPSEERARWKIVRMDSYRDVPGMIVSADEMTGKCVLEMHGENREYDLGHRGIRIMLRGR